jgi:hypothetical protein
MAALGLLGLVDGEVWAASSSVGTSTTCQPPVVQRASKPM